MTVIGWIQILLFCAIVVALVKPLGWHMTRVFGGEATVLSPVLRPIERGLYWIGGVDERREQHWLTYTVAMLLFHVGGFLFLYALMRFQAERAHRLYDEAFALLPEADRPTQKPGLMMANIYRTLLREIEAEDFKVLNQRISLTPVRKLWLAWKVQALGKLA